MSAMISKDAKFRRKKIGRIGIIDVGSNSVRLVVFDGFARSPSYFFNEKVLCGLGRGLHMENRLNKSGVEKAIKAIKRFLAITKVMDLTELIGVTTAAVRNASDGTSFVRRVSVETGLSLHITSGTEEANLSALGVLLGWPDASGVVCDIGGGSLEIADVTRGQVGACESSPLGSLVLQDYADTKKDLAIYLKKSIEKLCYRSSVSSKNMYLVGGSFRAFAKIDMSLSNYPLKVLHEYRVTADQAMKTAQWLAKRNVSDFMNISDSSTERLALLPMTALVLIGLLNELKPEHVYFSSYGLREGILFKHMPKKIRNLDPLIEACRYQEKMSSRFPGFGDKLFSWISPLFENLKLKDKRLYHAACLLHDTTWKSHPDYRAEVSFETVTRANLGGIDHAGRLFLALALMSRYKKISVSKNINDILSILTSSRYEEAIILGRAMRLGAMLSGTSVVNLKRSQIMREKNTLKLTLSKSAASLVGEAVERRLTTLAEGMNLASSIEVL
ncbi:MAG: Ppx/GppA family phosphatase [Pseudomonadota bacterium]|nr:Ppx/GppA family phosphatase [Pseudomonadota bacterium]